MTKIFFVLLTLASLGLRAQDSTFVATIPLVDGDEELGEIEAEIRNERLSWVKKSTLVEAISAYLRADTLKALERLPDRIGPEVLPFPLSYNPEKLVIEAKIGLELRSKQKTKLGIDLEESEREALLPSPFGGAINYNFEKAWASEELGGNTFLGQFNSFMNLSGVVLESQSYWQDNRDGNSWYRGDTRLVKDFQRSHVRAQLGDVYPSIQGFMVGRPMGGINIARNFALNPYRLPYPTGRQDFTLKSRSMVRYYVNSILIKTEWLPPGNYSATDIPLNNGLNTILIEATDELGGKQVFTFKTSSSINLLNPGETRFDLSYGTPFSDVGLRRRYLEREGKLFSGFFQYGFSRAFSASAYLQNQEQFNLGGVEMITATRFGNLGLGRARSSRDELNGQASSLTYQLITQGERWFDSHTVSLRYENREEAFRTTLFDTSAAVQNFYAANYTIPLASLLTVSAGANYGDVRDNDLSNRLGYDANISFRLLRDHSVSAFVSRTRDERRNWNDVAYVFVTFTFPESNNYFSTLYDHEQKNTRLTYLRDNQNRLKDVRTQITAENAERVQKGEVDLLYPTTFANWGSRLSAVDDQEANTSPVRGSLRMSSALVFAYQDGDLGFGLSRPVPGSFVMFRPERALRGQQIALRSTSPYNEASTGPFGEITFTNLLAYQYRDIQLDPTMMDEGRSLVKEKFVVYPTYRSAHLIPLHERGSVSLTGRLLLPDGKPASLQVGRLGQTTFFTNREGAFFVEGIAPGSHSLSLDGREELLPVNIDKQKRGLHSVGELRFKDGP